MIRRLTNTFQRQDRAARIAGELRLSAAAITGPGTVEPVPGFLYCNGAAVSRATYKRLFDLVGTAFGVGDGSTTFNLPDLRGRFLAGITDGSAGVISGLVRGGVLGTEAVALAKANLPAHTHGVGTYNVSSSGAHLHDNGTLATPNEGGGAGAGLRNANPGADIAPGVLGATDPATHSHSPDGGSVTGNAVADGIANADSGAVHQNTHPHQGIGGVLVAY